MGRRKERSKSYWVGKTWGALDKYAISSGTSTCDMCLYKGLDSIGCHRVPCCSHEKETIVAPSKFKGEHFSEWTGGF